MKQRHRRRLLAGRVSLPPVMLHADGLPPEPAIRSACHLGAIHLTGDQVHRFAGRTVAVVCAYSHAQRRRP